jgi:hypothetical protein
MELTAVSTGVDLYKSARLWELSKGCGISGESPGNLNACCGYVEVNST